MWNLRAGGYDTAIGLFKEDSLVIDTLINMGYQVEVMRFSQIENNQFRLYRCEPDPSTPRHAYRKVQLGEFDDVKEFVAMARLIVSSGTSGVLINRS
jgi:hypothetical protein